MIIFGNFITILLRRSTKKHPVYVYNVTEISCRAEPSGNE